MNILQINATYGEKSTGIITKDIHSELLGSGNNSYVACPNNSEKGVIKIGNILDSKIHALLTRITGKQGFYSKCVTKKLIKKIKKLNLDAIHLHNVHSNFINLPILFNFASKNNIPIIITFHDSWYFTGKCYHFADINCNKWQNICDNCPKRCLEIPSLFDNSKKVFELKKELYKKVNLNIVGCSKWITETAKKSPVLEGANFYQIYNGIDTTIFTDNGENLREKLNINGKFVILVMANKWFNAKNKEVCESIISYLDDTKHLIIVGCNESQKNLYTENENITTFGYTADREEMAKIYRTANVFINMTLIDTLPTVNMESVCSGTPVITYDAGGSGELVSEGVTGYVIPCFDKDKLFNAIQNIQNGNISRQICAKWGLENFSKKENFEKYITLYKEIIKRNKQDE